MHRPGVRHRLRTVYEVLRLGERRGRCGRGLRSARKGIYNSILALSAIKEGELHSIDGDVQEKEDTLAQIDEWEQKRAGLQTATRNTDDSEETIRAQRLRQDADVLQEEINSVELQLSDMKARHRKMIRQVAAVENSVQAKLASYTSSMSMLEADVQRFLTLKPADSEERPQLQNSKTSIWQLPPERRTLDMAREQYMEDKDAVVQHRQGIAHEKSALQEGAAVWKDVVAQVTDFEKRLRAEMSALSMSSSQSAWEDEPLPQPEHDNSERLKDLLTHLDKTLAHLDAQFKLAEEREWKLLIAAIGAEFDALRQGRSILQNVLGTTSPHTPPHVEHAQDLLDTSAETNGSLRARSESDNDDGNPIHELDRSFETARPAARPSARIEDSDTDVDADDPDPELLFSQQKVGE